MQKLIQRLKVIQADITQLDVDAIVNAANKTLLGGSGVDGAIHEAAGPLLHSACYELGGCETGHAKITEGFQLPARYIIHTVGPQWHGGHYNEPALLASCYRESLRLAVQYHCHTIAFPAISCGIYGFPVNLAAKIAFSSVLAFLKKDDTLEKIYFVCYGNDVYQLYSEEFILFSEQYLENKTEWQRAKTSSQKKDSDSVLDSSSMKPSSFLEHKKKRSFFD